MQIDCGVRGGLVTGASGCERVVISTVRVLCESHSEIVPFMIVYDYSLSGNPHNNNIKVERGRAEDESSHAGESAIA